MKRHEKRRIILIDHRFQLRLTAAVIALQILLTALFAAGLYVFLDSELHADLASAHASYLSLRQMLMPIVAVLAGFSIVLSIVLSTIFVVLMSHRIAGPMYRFRNVLELLAHRRFEAFSRLRPNDQLGEFAVSLDHALGTVKTDMRALQHAMARLREAQNKGDADAIATEIALIENVLQLWEKG